MQRAARPGACSSFAHGADFARMPSRAAGKTGRGRCSQMRRVWLVGAVMLLVLAGCSAKKAPEHGTPVGWDRQEPEHINAIVQTEPVPIEQQMAGKEGIIRVTVTDKGFEPAQITTTVGGRVRIHLVNQGTKEHTLTLPRWGIFTRNLGPGEENYIEFTANEKGDFTFFSDAPGAKEAGLEGVLKVE